MPDKPTYEELEQRVRELENAETERKRMDEALRESEEKYRSLVNLSPDPIVIVQDGNYKLVNLAFTELFGITRQDIEDDLSCFDFVHEKDRKEIRRRYEDRLAGRATEKYERINHLDKDGNIIPCEISATRIHYDGRPAALVIMRDITKQNQMEKEVQISNGKFSAAFQQSPNPIAITTVKNGRIIEMNDSFLRTSGYDYEEIVGKTSIEMNLWQSLEQREKYIELLQRHGEIKNFEMTFLDKSGAPGTGLISAAIIEMNGESHIISTLNDITERKQTEMTLEFERKQLLSIFDSIEEAISVSTFDTYEILYANKFLQDSLQKNTVGKVCYREFYGLDSPCDSCSNDIIMKKDKPYHQEVHNPTYNRDYSIVSRKIKWPDGRDVRLEFSFDITDRKRAEEALQKARDELEQKVEDRTKDLLKINTQLVLEIKERNKAEAALRQGEEKYRNLVNLVPDPIAIISGDRGLFVNQTFTDIFGYTIQDTKGLIPSDLVPESERDKIQARIKERLSGKTFESKYINMDIVSKDGKKIPCEVSGNLIEYDGQPADLVVIRDITERKQAEEALRESEEKYRLLVETSPHGIQELGTTMVVKYSNKAYCEMIGFSSEELTGKPVYFLAYPESEKKRMKEYAQFVVGMQPLPSTYHANLMTKAGKTIEVETDWNYKRDNNGVVTGFITLTTDITEKKHLQNRLIRSERMAATGQLAATIAHEINSPLQGIKALLYSIENSIRDDEELMDDIGLVKIGIQNITAIVKNLLDLNRPGKENKQDMNVNDAIEQTISLLQGHLRKNKIVVNLSLSPEIPNITASPRQLGQVFLNLINNAVEATTGVSQPDSRWPDRADHIGEISLTSERDKETIVIKISDNGPGIKEEDLERIFDPFYTRKKTMGMGIGLSVCHDIIKDHGGTIVAGNMTGGGAVFTIVFPLKIPFLKNH